MARRFIAGTGQLALALAGFAWILAWMFELFRHVVLLQLGEAAAPADYGWKGKWGLVLFGAGWLWSLATSISLWRQTKADAPAEPKPAPPRLTDLPGPPATLL